MFITDSQTVQDLGIFDQGGGGIYAIYNRTCTRGGAEALEKMLRCPLSDAVLLNQRTGIIRYFSKEGAAFPFDRELFDATEQYLAERDERTRISAQPQGLGRKLSGLIAADAEYKNILKGIHAVVELLRQLRSFVLSNAAINNQDYAEEREKIKALLSETAIASILEQEGNKAKLSPQQLALYDSILRFRNHVEVRKLLQYIYELDVYIAAGQTACANGFCFATADVYSANALVALRLGEVRHAAVAGAIGNDIVINSMHNVVFLTGANMAGKSTLMKSVGIAVYIAHCGLPVAAKTMTFTVMDGFFSTINLPDNLGMGASHFYAEVQRVKKVARELHAGKRLFVLFDELFRGTNVKDAEDATIAVVEGFAKKEGSLFVVSTHIIEAGKILQQKTERIQYRYMPTLMEGHKPVYTYQLTEGITEDRHGMVIIRNEGILEMLNASRPDHI